MNIYVGLIDVPGILFVMFLAGWGLADIVIRLRRS